VGFPVGRGLSKKKGTAESVQVMGYQPGGCSHQGKGRADKKENPILRKQLHKVEKLEKTGHWEKPDIVS